MQSRLREWLRAVHVPTFLFVCLFAMSSWIDINGVWVEVPLLVNELPESWNLPSYIVIIIQIANVGPLVYTVARKLAPDRVSVWMSLVFKQQDCYARTNLNAVLQQQRKSIKFKFVTLLLLHLHLHDPPHMYCV